MYGINRGLFGTSLRLTLRAPFGLEKLLPAIFSNQGLEPGPLTPQIKKETTRVSLFIWRRARDSNPRTLSSQWFSRPPLSTTQPALQFFTTICIRFFFTLLLVSSGVTALFRASCPPPLRDRTSCVQNRSRRFRATTQPALQFFTTICIRFFFTLLLVSSAVTALFRASCPPPLRGRTSCVQNRFRRFRATTQPALQFFTTICIRFFCTLLLVSSAVTALFRASCCKNEGAIILELAPDSIGKPKK